MVVGQQINVASVGYRAAGDMQPHTVSGGQFGGAAGTDSGCCGPCCIEIAFGTQIMHTCRLRVGLKPRNIHAHL